MDRVAIFNTLQALVSLYAFTRGGAPERVAALVLALAAFATYWLQNAFPARFLEIEYGVLAVDIVLFGVLVALSLYADRWWTLWVAAMQGLGAGAHLVKAIDPDTVRVVYAILVAAWSYPIVLLLFVGTLRHRRRHTRMGADVAWSRQGRSSAPF